MWYKKTAIKELYKEHDLFWNWQSVNQSHAKQNWVWSEDAEPRCHLHRLHAWASHGRPS